MKKTRGPLVPRYAYFPLALAAILNLAVYYGAGLLNAGRAALEPAIALDAKLPFLPWFFVFYVLAFPSWVVGYVMVAREDRDLCCCMVAGDVVAKLFCLACFLIVPTTITRPALGDSLGERLLGVIYFFDSPACNCFPSIHCLESWLCARMALKCKKAPSWYGPAMMVLAILVCASTVLIRQHLLLDVPAGILTAEVGLWVARRLGLDRALSRRAARKKNHREQALRRR